MENRNFEKLGLDKEIAHSKHVFTKINGYPSRVVHDSLKRVVIAIEKEKRDEEAIDNIESVNSNSSDQNTKQDKIFPYVSLPYKG